MLHFCHSSISTFSLGGGCALQGSGWEREVTHLNLLHHAVQQDLFPMLQGDRAVRTVT